ncbi:MAG: hypothetical protein AUI36_03255 [Cyanobacteria bacterium 13_1_40CM_2_61_4]|nr:MAG: hypothetical protein AUI36_03255 [Cyanobacteria bacterium 13_1_40CM_2_61_4]
MFALNKCLEFSSIYSDPVSRVNLEQVSVIGFVVVRAQGESIGWMVYTMPTDGYNVRSFE